MPPRSRTIRAALVAALAAVAAAITAPAALPSPRAQAGDLCADLDAGVQCGPGNNRQTPGGGDKVPHTGWPAVSGILWKVLDGTGHLGVGGPANDELLGHHGSDRLAGGPGDDILWGDWDPTANTTRQRDVLRGGAGDDWIYPSHGTTVVAAGPGRDYVWAFYGKGTIDCGPGADDTARVRLNGAFRVRNCEHIQHFCQFGADGHGGCRKPGETLALGGAPLGRSLRAAALAKRTQ
jgi:Ca2+-binding RTX toxin-like protein